MSVSVASRRRIRGLRAAEVRRDAAHLLRLLDLDAELSVALIGDAEMRGLNARYRHLDEPTDVLSFAQESAPPAGGEPALLGDVVISLDTAARQAERRGVGIRDEMRTLLAHGILHLLGYDHERSPAEARRMFALQRRLVAQLPRAGEIRRRR